MNEAQKKHFGEVQIAKARSIVWAGKADDLGLNVLAGFWREVANMLNTGLELQQRAMRDTTLLTQQTKTHLEKTTGRLFGDENEGSPKT